jgi:hypothetical protein
MIYRPDFKPVQNLTLGWARFPVDTVAATIVAAESQHSDTPDIQSAAAESHRRHAVGQGTLR